eukprot:5224893-Amphidinium_carterae.1
MDISIAGAWQRAKEATSRTHPLRSHAAQEGRVDTTWFETCTDTLVMRNKSMTHLLVMDNVALALFQLGGFYSFCNLCLLQLAIGGLLCFFVYAPQELETHRENVLKYSKEAGELKEQDSHETTPSDSLGCDSCRGLDASEAEKQVQLAQREVDTIENSHSRHFPGEEVCKVANQKRMNVTSATTNAECGLRYYLGPILDQKGQPSGEIRGPIDHWESEVHKAYVKV